VLQGPDGTIAPSIAALRATRRVRSILSGPNIVPVRPAARLDRAACNSVWAFHAD
jgi:hypothetical protein